MKKKILLVFLAFTFMCSNVFAGTPNTTTAASAPTEIPAENADVYAGVDASFNYSKISFTGSNASDADIVGSTTMRKILVTASPDTTKTSLSDVLGTKSFSAYCLDANLKYPEYNELTFADFSSDSNRNMALRVLFALYNNKDLYNKFTGVVGYNYLVGNGATYTLTTDASTDDAQTSYNAGNDVIVNVQKVEFADSSLTNTKTITATELGGTTDYSVTLKKSELLLNKYSSKSINSLSTSETEKYDKALWIIEHSYPTLTMEQSYAAAGTSYVKALAELSILMNFYSQSKTYDEAVAYMNTKTTNIIDGGDETTNFQNTVNSLDSLIRCANNTPNSSDKSVIVSAMKKIYTNTQIINFFSTASVNGDTLTFDESNITNAGCQSVLDSYVTSSKIEDYTYSTVQYAIWKVSDGYTSAAGTKLGDTLKGSTELNKLYQYLIKDREETKNYSSLSFTNTFKLNKPDSGKEIYKDEKDYYLYGPYTVGGDILSVDSINVSIDESTKGASVVDKDGNALSSVRFDEQFYIKCNKSDKVANVKVKLTGVNAKSFSPTTNRARIYYANNPTLQNVISGGKIVDVTVENSFDLVYNPKTGVVNLAIIFVIGIIAFTLGYVAINSKNQEIDLG